MKCSYYKENGCCSKGNNPYDKSDMGECIYGNGVITTNAAINCSESKKQSVTLLEREEKTLWKGKYLAMKEIAEYFMEQIEGGACELIEDQDKLEEMQEKFYELISEE